MEFIVFACTSADDTVGEVERELAQSKNKNGAGINLVTRNYAERYLASDGILSEFEKALTAGIMP